MKLFIVIVFLSLLSLIHSVDILDAMFKKIGTYADNGCNNKAYYLSRHLKGEFMTCQAYCKSFGMNLATFTTLAEYNNFKTIIANPAIAPDVEYELIFIGGSKIGASNWYWLPNGFDLSYTLNWGPGEPNSPVTEQCLSFYGLSGAVNFNDMLCMSLPIRFLCEKYL